MLSISFNCYHLHFIIRKKFYNQFDKANFPNRKRFRQRIRYTKTIKSKRKNLQNPFELSYLLVMYIKIIISLHLMKIPGE